MKTMTEMARRSAQALAGVGLAAVLVACGGGGGSAGTPVLGGGSGVTPTAVADLSVVLDKTSVTNTGAEVVKVTVTSVDTTGTVVGNVPVKFSVDNAGVVTPAGTKTDATKGVLTADVGIGEDRTNRKITITAVSGSITKSKSFNVVDSVSGGQVADLAIVTNRSTVPNDGSQTVQMTVTSLDALRSALGGAPVSFKVTDVGDAFVSTNGVTKTGDATGQIVATVSLGANRSNRSISVTATSGTVQRTVSFSVVDPIVSVPKASDITLLLDRTNVGNAGSETVTATVTAVDAQRNVISGIPVTFTVDNNATVAAPSKQTDASGVVTGAVRIGADKSNRLITVTAKSDTLVRTATFSVTGTTIQSTALPALPAAGSSGNKVEYRVIDVNQSAMAGVTINVSAPGLTSATGVTDANGGYVYSYTAPSSAGPIDITAVAAGKTAVQTITVPSGVSTVPAASPSVSTASLSASPSVVRVNTTTDRSNRTELRALFQGANNAPVKNVRVRFDLGGDTNSIGGSIASDTALVYSDAQGLAVTSYTPGERASPTNGLTIRACWDYNDFAVGTCPNQVLTNLTAVSDPLSITIGTDNTIGEGASKLTYVKRFVLLVVDAAGNPKSDVQITPSIDLLGYGKGAYVWNPATTAWELSYYLDNAVTVRGPPGQGYAATCAAEDVNRNGLIDTGEDYNGNGQLDPRKSDVSISMVGSTRTDASGVAILQMEYPKNVASWVFYRISASAAGVLSPPALYSSTLPVDGAAIKTESPPPAFVNSPYGVRRLSVGDSCASPF